MTRAEYLEYVQECQGFDSKAVDGSGYVYAPDMTLRDTPEVCKALQRAHAKYCHEVEMALYPERREDLLKEWAEQQQMWQLDDMAEKHRHLSSSEIMVESIKFAENLNRGHGHVSPRPDGVRARCGGPGLCPECSQEAAQKAKEGFCA